MTFEEKIFLQDKSKHIRKLIIEMIGKLGVGHIGGCLSIVEALVVLYYKQLNIDPKNPGKLDRDRFILSKGHAGPALYAVLADKGYFDIKELNTLNQPDTNLPSHCDMKKTIGIDMTAGSLGQGFSVAMGMALGAKLDGASYRIYTMIGDGESQEGQIWEAAQLAGHKKLNNVTAFLDNNNMQIDGLVTDILTNEPIEARWEAFGWQVDVVDGHKPDEINEAIEMSKYSNKPTMIVLKTIKGKGAFFAEGKVESHNMVIDEATYKKAIELLK